MRLAWKMGRVAGIDLYIHATFLLVFLFVPNVRRRARFESILLICSVFGCVLLHELGHALWLGGSASARSISRSIRSAAWRGCERMPRAPGAELLIALAGPGGQFRDRRRDRRLLFLGAAGFGLSWSFGLISRRAAA